jgi:transposase-like protein
MTKEITPEGPTTRRYTKQEKNQAVRLVFEFCKALGKAQGTVIWIADQLRYGTESLRRWVAQAEVDAWDVSDWERQVALQDALRTRFIENWCKVVQTVEHSKPLL